MKTKDKILDSALVLLNREGVNAITMRSVAKEVGIAHGNVSYYYPTTDAMIEALYMRLVEELNSVIGGTTHDKIDLKFVYKMTRQSFDILYAYRFLLLDFVPIMRRMPNIKTHYQQLTQMRVQQFQFLINQLIDNELLKPAEADSPYDSWIQSAILFGDYWLSHAEVLYDGAEENKVKTYHHMFMNLTAPYLTKKGLKQLTKVLSGE
jgi:AcrR family transcriptional regulator